MNRRGFFRRLGAAVGATLLPISILSYDPVKQAAIKPLIDVSPLVGFKGSAFMEAGCVYAPYIPLIQTCHIVDNPEFAKRYAESTINKRYYLKKTICG